jgi:hypothetical protein
MQSSLTGPALAPAGSEFAQTLDEEAFFELVYSMFDSIGRLQERLPALQPWREAGALASTRGNPFGRCFGAADKSAMSIRAI